MKFRSSARRLAPHQLCRATRNAGIAAAFLAATAAQAQNVPHQSAQRGFYGSGFGQQTLPTGGQFEPRVEVAAQYADNITLAEKGSPEVSTAGLEISPGFYASYSSGRLIAAIDYSVIGRAWEEGEFNDFSQLLDANGRWAAIDDLLFVNADASITDAVVNPASGLNYGNQGFFGSANLTDRASAVIAPVLSKRLGDFEALAEYSYGRVWYLGGDEATSPTFEVLTEDDSVDRYASVSFGTARTGGKLLGKAFYEWERSDYERALPYRYERTGIEGGFRFTRSWALVGDVGRESSLGEGSTTGGLDSSFWSAGFRWEPDAGTSAEARFGRRFFGDTYFALIEHAARFLSFDASYSESPQVESRRISLGEFDPGSLPPGFAPGVDLGLFNSSPYVAKDAEVGIASRGSRTTLRLSAFHARRGYLRQSLGDERGLGTTFTASRRMASNLSVDFSASYSDYQRTTSAFAPAATVDTRSYDTAFSLRANRTLSAQTTASLELGLLSSSGDTTYDGWWVGLRGRWSPVKR